MSSIYSRLRLTFIVALCSMMLGGCFEPAPEVKLDPLTAKITEMSGTVQVASAQEGVFSNMTKGQELLAGQQVLTFKSGKAKIEFSNGSMVNVAKLTHFTLEEMTNVTSGGVIRVHLEIGEMWIMLKGGSFAVETPTGAAGVRGSYLHVKVRKDVPESTFSCLEGECYVANGAGAVSLVAGLQAIIHDQTTPPQVMLMDPTEVKDWLKVNPQVTQVIPQLTATQTVVQTLYTTATFTPTFTETATPTMTGTLPPTVVTPTPIPLTATITPTKAKATATKASSSTPKPTNTSAASAKTSTSAPANTATTAPQVTATPTLTVTPSPTSTNAITYYSVTGHVLTERGSPISGASVSLSAGMTASTGSDGLFRFTEVQSGSYILNVSQQGMTFSPSSREIVVSGGNVSGQDFTKLLSLDAMCTLSGSASGVAVADNRVYVARGAGGLDILDTSSACPNLGGNYAISSPYSANKVSLYSPFASLTFSNSGTYGYKVINLSNASTPQETGSFSAMANVEAVVENGANAFLAEGDSGIVVVDVAGHSNPVETGAFSTSGGPKDLALVGATLYVAESNPGMFEIMDVSNPASPVLVGSLSLPAGANALAVNGNFAYVGGSDRVLRVISLENPASPVQVGQYTTPGVIYDVAVDGSYVYLADGSAGVRVLDVTDSTYPHEVVSSSTSGAAVGIAVLGEKIYAACSNGGLVYLRFW